MCAGSLSKALLGTVLCLLCSHLTALQASGWAPSPSKGWWKKKKETASVWIGCLMESILVSAEQRSCGVPMEHVGIGAVVLGCLVATEEGPAVRSCAGTVRRCLLTSWASHPHF